MKTCIIEVTSDAKQLLLDALAKTDILVVDSLKVFDRPVEQLLLEGDSLPDWCQPPRNGTYYLQATATIDAGNEIRFTLR